MIREIVMPGLLSRILVCSLWVGLMSACSSDSDRGLKASDSFGDVYAYANSCMSIVMFGGEQFVKSAGDSFEVSASKLDQAAKFKMQAAALGTYILLDEKERYLVSDGSNLQRRSSLASDTNMIDGTVVIDDGFQSEGEWDLVAPQDWGGQVWLRHRKSGGYLSASGIEADRTDTNAVELIEQTGCADFPELTVDAKGKVNRVEFDNGDVFGFVETHSHLLSNYGFGGGGVYHGSAFHRLGVEHALPDCTIPHGQEGRQDLLGYAFGNDELAVEEILTPLVLGETPGFNHATAGYPEFTDWPNAHKSATHQTQYYKWIDRARLAGMRLLVQHAMNISFLCDMFVALGNKAARYECNDMVSVDRIIEETYAMEAYIDAQEGGPGKGWFRIVKSPSEARDVIREGKLAVVLGIETAFLFDCFLTPPEGVAKCDESKVVEKLDEYYERGVRAIFPNHKFDSAFSAGDGHKRFIDIGNFALTGHWSNFNDCPDEVAELPTVFDKGAINFPGINQPREVYDSTPPELEGVSNFKDDPLGTLIPYMPQLLSEGPKKGDYCQNAGLTPLGAFLIVELIKRGMIIEIDHLPRRAYKKAFELLVEHDYPGVGTHGNNNNGRIYEIGGISKSDFRRCRSENKRGTMDDDYQARIQLMQEKGAFPAEGFGFDFNGFAGAPGPRFGEDSVCDVPQNDKLTYPFTSFAGDVTFYQPKAGNRIFDFNTEGMIHIGLVAELIEELRRDGVSDEELAPLFKSAEGYLRMWEKAESRAVSLNRMSDHP